MSRRLRLAALAALACAAGPVPAARGADCRESAVAALRALSPDGTAIYERTPDKGFFLQWITCDDVQLGLATAVHESVHAITAQSGSFPLTGGGDVAVPHAASALFPPSRIAGRFGPSAFVSTYLRPGRASSATDFLSLLDELNAYTHDLAVATDLVALRPAGVEVGHRDGLAATMAFVARYAETAREERPDSWTGLRQPEMAAAVSAIWGRAERVMAASCAIPGFGLQDRDFNRRVCGSAARSALAEILGRAPACPRRCLETGASPGDAAE